jgi:hypothetical protein
MEHAGGMKAKGSSAAKPGTGGPGNDSNYQKDTLFGLFFG